MVRLTRHFALVAVLLCACFTPAQRKYPKDFSPTQQLPAAQEPAPAAQSAATVPASTATVASGERKLAWDVEVSGTQQWTDTGIDVVAGDRVIVSAAGTVDYGIKKAAPEGLPRSWAEVISSLPVNSAGVGALIGRVGTEGTMPFLVGDKKEVTITRSGRLYLGINQQPNQSGSGAYKASVKITPAANKPQSAASATSVQLPSGTFSRLPRRIQDKEGKPGDMVNFIIIGPQEKMQQAFADAGWVLVDRTKADAALHALLSTYSKKVYTEMPMSELYLFGRPQDFGYAHAEPVQVVQTRHHLRIWKADFDIDGQPVWIGAATHDIGFEHDNRSQKATAITHKIDPDVDKEREFVAESLNATGDVAALSRVTPPDPLREAQTATGGSFHSDGQVLVIHVN